MRKVKGILVLLAVIWVCGATRAPAAHTVSLIGWLNGGGTLVLVQGQTYEYEASFCAENPLENAYWTVTKGLQGIFGSDAKFVTNLILHEVVYTIRYTIQVPRDFPPGTYDGKVVVMGSHGSQPGPAGGPNVGAALNPQAEFLDLKVEVVAAP